MGLFVSTAANLMLTYSGMCGIEALLARYATPEARTMLKKEGEPSPATSRNDAHGDGTREA